MKYDILNERYPLVYGSGVYFGVPDEWYDVLESLSRAISSHLSLHPRPGFRVDQVKEKYGGLRYYVSDSDEVIDSLIEEAENLLSSWRSTE